MQTTTVERCKCCESIRRSEPFGEITVDTVNCELITKNHRVPISGRVLDILSLLARRTYVSREGLEIVFSDIDSANVEACINVTIHKARAALSGTGFKIKNIRGYGYQLEKETTQ